MGRITSEEIERFKIEEVPHIYKVTLMQGNDNYCDRYIQQITEKTIVLIWDYKTVYRLNLDGTARNKRHGVSLFQIEPQSLEKMKQDMLSRNLATYHSGFRPFKLEKYTMLEQAEKREYYQHVDNQHNYIIAGKRIIDCTTKHGDSNLNVVPKKHNR